MAERGAQKNRAQPSGEEKFHTSGNCLTLPLLPLQNYNALSLSYAQSRF